MLIGLLERIGDKEVTSNVLNTKRRKTRAAQGRGRELRVAKRTRELHLIEVLVKNVYGAQVEIGGVQEGALSVSAQGQAFVADRSRNGQIVGFLEGYGDAELQWLAKMLRRALTDPR